jgi:hypothetical protein
MSPTTINENGDRTIETNNGFQYRNLKDDENYIVIFVNAFIMK